jgi:hypothetical protein
MVTALVDRQKGSLMYHKTLLTLCISVTACVGAAHAQLAGVVKGVTGNATIDRLGSQQAIVVGAKVFTSDRIVTGADSTVGIMLRDNTMLSAGPNSILQMNKFAFDSTTNAGTIDASVKRGTVAVISGKIAKATPENVSFSTPSMTLGVRGTEFVIDAGQRAE